MTLDEARGATGALVSFTTPEGESGTGIIVGVKHGRVAVRLPGADKLVPVRAVALTLVRRAG